jgi:hypothetical protein
MNSTAQASVHPTLARLDALAATLAADPAVVAVFGLGSAGVETSRFDEHSDIDFFVIVEDAAAKHRYIESVDWLAGFGGTLVYDFRNDANGRKALFEDGLFLEYAIFTAEELPSIPFAGPRIVWSRPGFALTEPPRPRRAPDFTSDEGGCHLGEALTNLFVGLHRELRGERLTAMRFIQVSAVDHVLALADLGEGSARTLPDPFDPTRRVEASAFGRRPPLAELIPGYEHNAAAAAATLAWLERWHAPEPAITAAIRGLLDAARSTR